MTVDERPARPIIRIAPAPSSREAAALVAAITAALGSGSERPDGTQNRPDTSGRWIRRARLEMLRGDPDHFDRFRR